MVLYSIDVAFNSSSFKVFISYFYYSKASFSKAAYVGLKNMRISIPTTKKGNMTAISASLYE